MTEKPKVLIVDNNPNTQQAFEAILFQDGYNLAFAASEQETFERISQFQPDVILLDAISPETKSYQICKNLKTNPDWQHIPVVMMTPMDNQEHLLRGFVAGADDFLSKSSNDLELRLRMRSILSVKKQRDKLSSALRLRESLSNMIVHDLRGPLAAILISGQVLKESLKDASESRDKVLRYVNLILDNAQHLESFVSDLLIVAKTQQDRLILNRKTVDVNQLVNSVKTRYEEITASQNITLNLCLSEIRPYANIDEDLIRRVLDNLLSNAIKFSPRSGTVTITVVDETLTADPPQIRITLQDEGPGIAKEHQERIFEQFGIAELNQPSIQQLGLGLAFCKLVINAHGGQIWVESEPDNGAIFGISLPA